MYHFPVVYVPISVIPPLDKEIAPIVPMEEEIGE